MKSWDSECWNCHCNRLLNWGLNFPMGQSRKEMQGLRVPTAWTVEADQIFWGDIIVPLPCQLCILGASDHMNLCTQALGNRKGSLPAALHVPGSLINSWQEPRAKSLRPRRWEMLYLLWVPNIRERAIQGNFITDVDVKSIFSVCLIHSLSIGHGVRSALFSIS